MTGAVTFFVGAAISAFLFLSNPHLSPFEGYHLVNDSVLLGLPLIVIILFLKEEPIDFGMTGGDREYGFKATLIAILCMLPILWYASRTPDFVRYYGNTLSQPLAVGNYVFGTFFKPHLQLTGLLYYESMMGFYFFCWEFFFRGFLLFGMSKFQRLGNWGAIIVQTIPFTLLHWSLIPAASKPPMEILSAFFGGLILGWLAIRTKSFLYGFLIHWAIALGLDLLLVVPYVIHHGN